MFVTESAQAYLANTPLPGQAAESEDIESLAGGEVPPSDPKTPF